jgi:ribosome-associated toxin RatA of RatAB toxin-antitoxin module
MTSLHHTQKKSWLPGALAAVVAFAVSAAPTVSLAADADAEAKAENAGIFTAQVPSDGSNIAGGRAVIVVEKPIDEVLPVLLDYNNYVDFMPNFTRSKVLAQRGSRAMVYMEVSVARGMYTLYGQLNLKDREGESGTRVVEGRLIDGNINAFNATFTLTPVRDGTATEIDFNIYVDPDLPLPSSVFSRENERAAGRAVRALRTRLDTANGGTV